MGEETVDLIKDKFLKQLWDKTSEIFNMVIQNLENQELLFSEELVSELNSQIKLLRDNYSELALLPPKYITISYLRSSLFDGYPWFQISMYDKDYFYSGRECSVWLKVPILTECLSEIMDEVNQAFRNQTRVEEFYKDEFLIIYGDQLYQWLRRRMRKMIEIHVFAADWESFYIKNEISIMFGEYKNQLVRIF